MILLLVRAVRVALMGNIMVLKSSRCIGLAKAQNLGDEHWSVENPANYEGGSQFNKIIFDCPVCLSSSRITFLLISCILSTHTFLNYISNKQNLV